MKVHELKINRKYFEAVKYGIKKFLVRKNDCNFETGDTLILREWDKERYTGCQVVVTVTYIIDLEDMGLDGSIKMGIR